MTKKHHWFSPYFPIKPIVLMSRYDRWRHVARHQRVSKEALSRLEWIIYYETKGGFNASLTCRHFDLVPKTFYKFLNRFDSADMATLENRSRTPHNTRQKEITLIEEQRVVLLRREMIHAGKEKIRLEYNERYSEDISGHKILYTIQKHNLYPSPARAAYDRQMRQRLRRKHRIGELKKRNKQTLGFLVQLDTIVLHLFGLKRYIITAIDKYGKLAYARAYKNPSSYCAADFLRRLHYLLDKQIVNIQTDNGSEFAKYFERACGQLSIAHYFSRARTPKDNAVIERFNRTLQEEWLNDGNFYGDIDIFNQKLTEWLVYYNFKRRHRSLDNLSPIDYCVKTGRVLPMYSTHTLG